MNEQQPASRRHKRAALIAASGIVASFAALSIVALFSTVTQYDAVSRLKLIDPAGSIVNPRPTDLYAIKINDRGRDISGPLCISEEGQDVSSVVENYEFNNILGGNIPFLLALNGSLFESGSTEANATLTWKSNVDYLSYSEVAMAVTSKLRENPNCNITVEEHIEDGYKVCPIQKVFANQDRTSVFAVSFNKCILICKSNEDCSSNSSLRIYRFLPVPIIIKDWLGLINYKKI